MLIREGMGCLQRDLFEMSNDQCPMTNKFTPQDRYFKKAQKEGYRARSVYKLEAIQNKFHILKPGDKVLDLGAAPGSFLQYMSKIIGEKGIAIGIDLQDIKNLNLPNVKTYVGDIFDDAVYEKIGISKFDVITSDLAPKTSGVKFLDAGRSLDLSLKVLDVAKGRLKKGGSIVIKILSGFNEGDLIGEAKKLFKTVKISRPDAVRKSSGEKYIICLNKL
jgi:23S rRNA (uridine2552-2'-O)-methyltransferase